MNNTAIDTILRSPGLSQFAITLGNSSGADVDVKLFDINNKTPFESSTAQTGWSAQTSGTLQTLRDVFFITNSIGWIVGQNGTVLKTTNGGTTWSAQTSGTTQYLTSVFFLDSNNGWAVGGTTIIGTSNGGTTWNVIYAGFLGCADVYFFNTTTGVVADTTANRIKRTTDSGATWSDVYTGAVWNFTFYGSTGWAIDDKPASTKVVQTTDSGASWSVIYTTVPLVIRGIYFVNSTNGWFCGAGGGIYKTTNGGTTWSAQTSGTSNVLMRIFFTDTSTGWAVGLNGTVLKTTNGGTTWSAQTSGTMQNLFGVYFFNSTTGWAVGDTGTILKATTTTTAASISINISNGLSYNSLLELFVTGQYAFERIVEIAANSINYLNLNISYFVNVVTRNQYTIPVYLRIDPNQRQNVLTDIPGYGIALNGQNYISATIPNGAEYDIIFEVIDGNQAGFQNSPQAGDKAQRPIPVIAGNSGGGVDNEIKKSELALTEIDKILIQLTNHKQW